MMYLLLIGSSGKFNWTDCDVMKKSILKDHIHTLSEPHSLSIFKESEITLHN
jgi:REP element-mobilizing transposase RayT